MSRTCIHIAAAAWLLALVSCVPTPAVIHDHLDQLGKQAGSIAALHKSECPAPRDDAAQVGRCAALLGCLRGLQGAAAGCQGAIGAARPDSSEDYETSARSCAWRAPAAIAGCHAIPAVRVRGGMP